MGLEQVMPLLRTLMPTLVQSVGSTVGLAVRDWPVGQL